MFKRTTAINKILAMKSRKKVIQGGTSSGKTYGIIPVIIDKCIRGRNLKATVVAETIPAVKDGALKIFKDVMRDTMRWEDHRYNSTERTYLFPSGSELQFKSFDDIGKAHASGKRDILFINEANYIAYGISDALITRTTGDIYIDFNPTVEFWAHTEILNEPDAGFLLLKYTDNEACPETTIQELNIKLSKAFFDPSLDHDDPSNIKSEYWSNWCKVYIDGELGTLDGMIFKDWDIIDNIPGDAVLECIGMDFGFTNSYTAIVAKYKWQGISIYDEVAYQRQMGNKLISEKLRYFSGMVPIYADSEDPRTINELVELGIDVVPVKKGKDSVQHSIDSINQNRFLITASSRNGIKELRGYLWEKDATGKPTNQPVKKDDHFCDALRYTELGEPIIETKYYAY